MTEKIIPQPVTRQGLAAAFGKAGVQAGDIVCLHASMASLGNVIGGARTVVEALLDAVGDSGTMMMPTYSGDLSDPGEWRHPPIPAETIDEVRAAVPAYDQARTPTRGMGVVAEYFRTYPGVRRSPHPQSSFAALGARAEDLVTEHPYSGRFGPDSPLGKLNALSGKVLLVGAPWDTVSLFHMTQHFMADRVIVRKSSPVEDRGIRAWVDYEDIEYPTHWFIDGVTFLLSEGLAVEERVFGAQTVLFPAAEAVDAIVKWRNA